MQPLKYHFWYQDEKRLFHYVAQRESGEDFPPSLYNELINIITVTHLDAVDLTSYASVPAPEMASIVYGDAEKMFFNPQHANVNPENEEDFWYLMGLVSPYRRIHFEVSKHLETLFNLGHIDRQYKDD